MRRLLLVSQVYPPDPASLGQHLHDAARALVARGWRVRVLTSARGYEDPRRRYPRRELRDGVEVVRLAWGSLGKATLRSRAAGGLLFLTQALLRGLVGPRPAGVLVSTSPPMAPLAGRLLAALRRAPLLLWLMDLNPDQAVASGAVAPEAWAARLLEHANRVAGRGSREVVVLDRFMAERIQGRWLPAAALRGAEGGPAGPPPAPVPRLTVLPPWPHEEQIAPIPHLENPFRSRHGLTGKRVVMYSGNLSPVHPLDTILQAAHELREEPDLVFVFIGGGGQRATIEAAIRDLHLGHTTRLLPYQPLDEIRYSLSAADVHLVSMGVNMVGIVHPCKVYGAMAAARPVLFLGPRRSHIGELLERFAFGWQVEQGDVPAAVTALGEIARLPEAELQERGRRARLALARELSQDRLVASFCDLVERGVARGESPQGAAR